MQRKRTIRGRLVRAEVAQLLRRIRTRQGGPGGGVVRRARGVAFLACALLAAQAGAASAAPVQTPDPYPTATTQAPARTPSPSPDPFPTAGGAASQPEPEPAPASPTSAPPSSTVSTAPSTPVTRGTSASSPRERSVKSNTVEKNAAPPRARPLDPVAAASPPVPDRIQRAVTAALAVAVAPGDDDGSGLLLGGLGLITLVLASSGFLVLLARAGALETRA